MIATCNCGKTAQSTLTVCTHTHYRASQKRNNPFNFCSYFSSACIHLYFTQRKNIHFSTNFC